MNLKCILNHYSWQYCTIAVESFKTLTLLLCTPYFHILATFLILDETHVLTDLFSILLIFFDLFLCVPEPLVNLLFFKFQTVRQLGYLLSPRVVPFKALEEIPEFLFLILVLALSPTLCIVPHDDCVSSCLSGRPPDRLVFTIWQAFVWWDSCRFGLSICFVTALLVAFAHRHWQCIISWSGPCWTPTGLTILASHLAELAFTEALLTATIELHWWLLDSDKVWIKPNATVTFVAFLLRDELHLINCSDLWSCWTIPGLPAALHRWNTTNF